MITRVQPSLLATAAFALLGSSCGISEPELPPYLEFSEPVLDLGLEREGQIEIRNTGGQSIGPIELVPGEIRDLSGSMVPGSRLSLDPAEIPTLNPGDKRLLTLQLSLDGSLNSGEYDTWVRARGGGCALCCRTNQCREVNALLSVRFTVLGELEAAVTSVRIVAPPFDPRTGDVINLPLEARDEAGTLLQGVPVYWSVNPSQAGYVGKNGQFVGYQTGAASIIAQAGTIADTLALNVLDRNIEGSFSVALIGREVGRYTSDLWLHGDVLYSGTWGTRQTGSHSSFGNTLNVWDISVPGTTFRSIQRSFSIEIDARVVNDVKVRTDGELAIITHEGSNDALNGITILDLDNPLEPTVVSRFTAELESGVHNVWIEGDYAYLVVDGVGNGLRILNISDPENPSVIARFWAGKSFLHDVYVRGGLAFLSHWNAGLVILDVGNGIADGSPENPVEVSRLSDLGGQTHNAWYWPEAGYVFVGEEDFDSPGIMHVVDLRNLLEPREVATFKVPGQTPHNFWLDESTGTLYLAWYGNGVRALDVTGDLLGELDRQGREIAGLVYNGGSGTCNRGSGDTCTWAPQFHRGLVWVSDMNEGLVGLEPPR